MVKINLQGYSVEPITSDNLNRYEDVFYCNTEYYMVTEGRAATKKDCEETFAISRERTEENFRRGIVGRLVDSVLRVFETLL